MNAIWHFNNSFISMRCSSFQIIEINGNKMRFLFHDAETAFSVLI